MSRSAARGGWRGWRTRVGIATAAAVLGGALQAPAAAAPPASYRIELVSASPPRFVVSATLPAGATRLAMATSRPADIAEVATAGWPGLVRELTVTDDAGRAVAYQSAGDQGWTLAPGPHGRLTLRYAVDLAPLARQGWPAAREAAYADSSGMVVLGRMLFVTVPGQQASEVETVLPRGWRAVLPWRASQGTAAADSGEDLTENLLAFVAGAPDLMSAGGFDLQVVAFGHWRPARAEVRRVLGATLRRVVEWMGFAGRADYLVVLLPQPETGGEAFRASFALNSEPPPSGSNRGRWGNTIIHEVLHFWNGWRLRGADYAASQWFQEGVTEYLANLALVATGTITPREFEAKLAAHSAHAARLATPLEAPGTRKGPPLYSKGALVALHWDVTLRERTGGARGLAAVLRALLERTGGGSRPYEWADIEAALGAVADGDWSDFHRRHIHGTEPLPLAAALSRIGLVLTRDPGGEPRVVEDPAAPAAARALRRTLLAARP